MGFGFGFSRAKTPRRKACLSQVEDSENYFLAFASLRLCERNVLRDLRVRRGVDSLSVSGAACAKLMLHPFS
jgi:hypothetical protein